MKLFRRILLGLVVLVVVAVSGGYAYLMLAFPAVGEAPDITVEITDERIERGRYLADHVAMCIDCHSERDWGKFAGPVVEGSYGGGGELFGEEMGLPGDFYASNITPFHLRDWSDGELYRAITSGVSRDGRALFPIMPYPNFGRMDKEDIYAIIAYLRTLPSIEHSTPASTAKFPMSLIMRTIPSPAQHTTRPDIDDRLAYGEYMTIAASCGDCHTPMVKGEPVPGMEFAGNMAFELPAGTLRSSNITPDRETGIGAWTEDMFVQRFKSYVDSTYVDPVVAPHDYNTVMPWRMYGGMTEEDLRAIYAWLMTRKPVSNAVERFTPRY
jgi:mono/diheme cytochrome c family protein